MEIILFYLWAIEIPKGLYYNQSKNFVLSTEHGPQGGDEINLITLAKKYLIMAGLSLHMVSIMVVERGEININIKTFNKSQDCSFEEPLKYFVPSIAPLL